MPQPARPILPAPTRPTKEGGSGPPPPGSTLVLKARRTPTQVACQGCRTRKAKCDGARPQCALCVRKGAACHYDAQPSETRMQALKRKHDELRRHSSVYEELYHQLLALSEAESIEILRRLRAGADVTAVVRQIRDGDLLLHVALTPDARSQRDRERDSFSTPRLPGVSDLLQGGGCKARMPSPTTITSRGHGPPGSAGSAGSAAGSAGSSPADDPADEWASDRSSHKG